MLAVATCLPNTLGGKHFMVPYTVSWNGYRVNTTTFINTGVNGFTFINITYANDIAKFLNIEAIRLEKPI